jgi:hypothetical protein
MMKNSKTSTITLNPMYWIGKRINFLKIPKINREPICVILLCRWMLVLIVETGQLMIETERLKVETGHALSLKRQNNGPFEYPTWFSNKKNKVPFIQNTHDRYQDRACPVSTNYFNSLPPSQAKFFLCNRPKIKPINIP